MDIHCLNLVSGMDLDEACKGFGAAMKASEDIKRRLAHEKQTGGKPVSTQANYSVRLGDEYASVLLTEREAHCALFMILGYTSKEISEKINISSRTVESYLNQIKRKLGLKRRSEIITVLLQSNFLNSLHQAILSQDHSG